MTDRFIESLADDARSLAGPTSALQRERDTLSALVESISDEVWFADANANVNLVNPAVREEFGAVGQGPVEAITAALEIYRADGSPRTPAEAPLLRALHGESIRDEQEIIRTPAKGELRHRLVTASPVRDTGGAIIGSVCVVRDITEHRQAEDALRESRTQNESLGILLDSAEQPFGLGYADGSLGYVNPAFERLTGYSRKELQTLDWAVTLTPPEWREAESGQLEELNRTGRPVRYEKEYVRKDGSRVPIELIVHLVRDAEGRPEQYYSLITDLTERRRAEEELRKSEARFRAIVELADEDLAASSDETYYHPKSVADTRKQRGQFRARFIALAAVGRRHRLLTVLVAVALELAFLIPLGLLPTTRHVLGLPGSLLMLIVVITAVLAGWQAGLVAAVAGGLIFWGAVADFGTQSAPLTTLISTGLWVVAALISGLLADALRDQTRKRKSAAVALARAETLREHEAERAAQEERTRIARDLHDSVTQSLFAATLKAEALTECGDPAQEPIANDVRRLSRGALAQMRTLLLELRGDPVQAVPMTQLLRNLVEAAESRASVKVTLTLNEGSALPAKVHEAAFRITQEALNNVVRHAKAQHARVQLEVEPSHARLLIGDDGGGFDPAGIDPGHFGLKSMRERAVNSGGDLTLRSVRGEGTLVTVQWRFQETVGTEPDG